MKDGVRQALATAMLVLVALTFTAGVLELGLRLFWGGYYVKYDPARPWGTHEFHPVRGWTPIPGLSVVTGTEEFTTTFDHNSLGFRGAEIPEELPRGVQRVLVIGDSMTYGKGVETDETYSAVLDALEPRFSVVNLGVQGYSGAQQLLTLRELGPRLEPDIVVLAFFWNDLPESFKPSYAHFELDGDTLRQVLPDPATAENPKLAARNRLMRRRSERYAQPWRRTYLHRFLSDRLKVFGALLEETFRGRRESYRDLDGRDEEAWALTFALTREMAREARALGARPLLFVIPDQTQVEPDVHVVGVPAYLKEVQERMTGFARTEGLPVVDPLPLFIEQRQQRGAPFYHRLDRHWNASGHRLAAEILHEALERPEAPAS